MAVRPVMLPKTRPQVRPCRARIGPSMALNGPGKHDRPDGPGAGLSDYAFG